MYIYKDAILCILTRTLQYVYLQGRYFLYFYKDAILCVFTKTWQNPEFIEMRNDQVDRYSEIWSFQH